MWSGIPTGEPEFPWGMQNDNMHYLLEAGEELQSPEAILSFGDGLSALSNQLQSMVKKYIAATSPLPYFRFC